jgi:hypothetical protein
MERMRELFACVVLSIGWTACGGGVEDPSDQAQAVAASSCGTSCKVFITSGYYTGNMGGLSGADAICQRLASGAGLSGTYRAWLSSSTVSAASRLYHSPVPYVLVNGTIVANNWTDLTDGALTNQITTTERGVYEPNSVWTNTNSDGSLTGTSCSDWTSSGSTTSGTFGVPQGPYGTAPAGWGPTSWSIYGAAACSSNGLSLYCIEQSAVSPSPSSAPY